MVNGSATHGVGIYLNQVDQASSHRILVYIYHYTQLPSPHHHQTKHQIRDSFRIHRLALLHDRFHCSHDLFAVFSIVSHSAAQEVVIFFNGITSGVV